ncbi:MAG: cyclase family protein [Pseudonocardia sp.]|nr:cyclase family protein [Pseudonocardia sp.]
MRSYRDLLNRTDGPPGSAWGEFGPDDELGSIGRLTPDRARAGAECVRTGEVFNLDLPIDAMDPPLAAARRPARHTIFGRNAFHRDEHLDDVFPQVSSQIDGLRHFGHPDHGFYNGAPGDRLVVGDPRLGVQHWAEHGIVGRAVLVDVAGHRDTEGRPIDHRAGEPIPIADVIAAAERQGSRFEPGDILLLRFGWVPYYRAQTTEAERRALPAEPRHPGLLQSHDTLEWLWDNGFALVAADNYALECWPPVPSSPFLTEAERGGAPADGHTGLMHRFMIPLLGLAVGELWALDQLAAACARDGRYECLVVAKPINLVGGVGTPANATAVR